jgi:hypothetical protein
MATFVKATNLAEDDKSSSIFINLDHVHAVLPGKDGTVVRLVNGEFALVEETPYEILQHLEKIRV